MVRSDSAVRELLTIFRLPIFKNEAISLSALDSWVDGGAYRRETSDGVAARWTHVGLPTMKKLALCVLRPDLGYYAVGWNKVGC
jgi:hypothetical protein